MSMNEEASGTVTDSNSKQGSKFRRKAETVEGVSPVVEIDSSDHTADGSDDDSRDFDSNSDTDETTESVTHHIRRRRPGRSITSRDQEK